MGNRRSARDDFGHGSLSLTRHVYVRAGRRGLAALRAHRAGKDDAVPEGVQDREWVVVTPGVECIPTVDARYWLTPTVPRICTPEELIDFACAPVGDSDQQL